jgi:hypothetical protein
VADALRVTPVRPEARDRAVDDGLGQVVRTDPEPGRDAGPEPLEDDVDA